MSRYLESIANSLLERTAEELIVGVFLALLLSLAAAGIYAFAASRRKGRPESDSTMILTVLILVANLAGMLLAAGYVRMAFKVITPAGQEGFAGPGLRPRLSSRLVRDLTAEAASASLFEAADANRDGVLSADEAADASARFVREAEARAGKPVDLTAVTSALKDRVKDVPFPVR